MAPTHPLSLFVVVLLLSALPSSIARSPPTSPFCRQKDMRFPVLCQSIAGDARNPDSPEVLLRAALQDAVALAGSAEAKADSFRNEGCSSAFDDAGEYFQKALGYLDAGAKYDLTTELSATLGALHPCSNEFDEARESPVGAAYTKLFRLAVVSLTLADSLK